MDYEKEQLNLNASCILQRELNEKGPNEWNNKEKSPCTEKQKVHFSRRGHYKTKAYRNLKHKEASNINTGGFLMSTLSASTLD
jgi:hypothetical protein